MALLSIKDVNKDIRRTRLQRELLVISPLFNEAEKEEFRQIYNQYLQLLRKAVKNQFLTNRAKEIKVVKPEIIS